MKHYFSLFARLNNFFYSLIILLLTSCASISEQKVASSFTYAYDAVKNAVFGYPDLNITREIVENIPYASALLKIGKGTQGLVILETVENNNYAWVSKDNVYIVNKDGRIVRSLNLLNNLTKITSINQSFEDLITKPNPVSEYYSYYSFKDPLLLNLKVNVSVTNKGLQEIEILGKSMRLILIEESITSELIGWKAKNKFWVDPDNYFVWKSIQNISPKLPEFIFEVTKSPAS